MVELQLGTSIKRLETNGGGEFKAFHTFLQSCGILHHASCLHIHEQNGLSKRKHPHIIEVGFTLLVQPRLPLSFWDHAFLTIVHTINRLPTPILHSKSSFKTFLHKKKNHLILIFKYLDPDVIPYSSL